MTLRTVIVDDEPLARDLLSVLLAEHEEVQIVATCKNGREAIAYLQSEPVDLLFLDAQMPRIDGFRVVEQVGLQHMPATIFVTAFQEHAVRAFDVHAVDYLTKPVSPKRLAIALERAQEKIAAKCALMTQAHLTAVLDGLRHVGDRSEKCAARFLVKDGEREIFLPVEDIDWIEAATYYSCLHSNGRRYMLRESIADLNEKLDERTFVRIHRSAIVNLARVKEIYREGQAEACVILMNGSKLKMSRAGRQRLMELGRG